MEHFDLDAVAALARLSVPSGERESLSRDMDAILAFASTLPGTDSAEAEDAVTLSELRTDMAADFPAKDLIAAAPATRDGFFTVPAVMEE